MLKDALDEENIGVVDFDELVLSELPAELQICIHRRCTLFAVVKQRVPLLPGLRVTFTILVGLEVVGDFVRLKSAQHRVFLLLHNLRC